MTSPGKGGLREKKTKRRSHPTRRLKEKAYDEGGEQRPSKDQSRENPEKSAKRIKKGAFIAKGTKRRGAGEGGKTLEGSMKEKKGGPYLSEKGCEKPPS